MKRREFFKLFFGGAAVTAAYPFAAAKPVGASFMVPAGLSFPDSRCIPISLQAGELVRVERFSREEIYEMLNEINSRA